MFVENKIKNISLSIFGCSCVLGFSVAIWLPAQVAQALKPHTQVMRVCRTCGHRIRDGEWQTWACLGVLADRQAGGQRIVGDLAARIVAEHLVVDGLGNYWSVYCTSCELERLTFENQQLTDFRRIALERFARIELALAEVIAHDPF